MKWIVYVAIPLIAVPLGFAQNKSDTFTGEVMDKACAQMHSHDNMMKSMGAKDAKECTLACVKNGDSFALLDAQTQKIYPIEDEKKAREYAVQRVQITGSYDQDADVLHIKTITPAH